MTKTLSDVLKRKAVDWGFFGVINDPDFCDYRARLDQQLRTLARIERLRYVSALRRARGFTGWEARV